MHTNSGDAQHAITCRVCSTLFQQMIPLYVAAAAPCGFDFYAKGVATCNGHAHCVTTKRQLYVCSKQYQHIFSPLCGCCCFIWAPVSMQRVAGLCKQLQKLSWTVTWHMGWEWKSCCSSGAACAASLIGAGSCTIMNCL